MMTQVSLPQAGDGVGDSGPYTADEWAKFYEVVFTGDQAATQGVLAKYLNELEVTSAGNIVSIDTGGGFCYGHWLDNDASVDITALPCAGIETSWHRVVLVQNDTAVAYNTNLMLPAAYPAGVPRNSCRIAILRGVCGSPGALPALLTGPDVHMVELARYQITGGSIGTITDYRDYCDFSTLLNADSTEDRTRRIWVPALTGYDGTDVITTTITSSGPTLAFPDGVTSYGMGRTVIPADFDVVAQEITVTAVLLTSLTNPANIYAANTIYLGSCGNDIAGQTATSGITAEAMTTGAGAYRYSCVHEIVNGLTITPANAEFIRCYYERYAGDALDTIDGTAYFLGWWISYTADS